VFCCVTGRRPRIDPDTRSYFDIGDRGELSYGEKLGAYRELADVYFDTDHYREFCAEQLPDLDERVLEWIKSAHFERLLFDTVRMGYPPHEHDQFMAHFHGLIDMWVRDESARLESASR
jgi:hypothetical protein